MTCTRLVFIFFSSILQNFLQKAGQSFQLGYLHISKFRFEFRRTLENTSQANSSFNDMKSQ
ncbi:hypothetical protein O6H91_08G006400 [Diphasiastrum complanatum]|uniref:Uncharacterized protein n=1 Tax=Diphasiastrum complanatum TaxID=34168 RepID=A0ACC2CUQ8_DIPCM|nr:hypothetical protein O6H91_08G006400 [Diphasiastrum complanatum]